MSGNRREKPSPRDVIPFYAAVLLILAADQASKFLALAYLSLDTTVPLVPSLFHLTLVYNRGIAFGLFRHYQPVLLIFITVSLGVLFFLAHKMVQKSKLSFWAVALILGGALGNWIDRIRLSCVVDFLDFRVWPVFNLADSAITVGVTLYLIQVFWEGKNRS